ncbi:MAG: glycosyltransferase family 4 protein [Sandaracinaceae bacterium]
MHLVFVQYGDYAEGYRRLERDEAPTYYGQRYTIEVLGELAKERDVTVVSFQRDAAEERLPNGVRSLGVQLFDKGRWAQVRLIRKVAGLKPTHLVVASPILSLLVWARHRRGLRVLPLFADSFRSDRLRDVLHVALIARELNHPTVEWVSNHSIAACLDLRRIGVDPAKIVPFDWPAFLHPRDRDPKPGPDPAGPFRLIYVGSLDERKGIGDLVDAVGVLREDGSDVRLSVVGGTDEQLARRARVLGIEDAVAWLGRQTHDWIVPLMNEHDAVVVPSRHDYPEGLPMTIYEGLSSRSPVIVSDHPMFSLRMHDGENSVVFEAGNAGALADAVRRLRETPDLYRQLSEAAEAAADGYLCPLTWDHLLTTWLSEDPEVRETLAAYALTSDHYPGVLEREEFAPRSVVGSIRASVGQLVAGLRGHRA